MNQRAEFAAIIAGLCSMFGREATPALVELYWRAIGHVPAAELREAATKHIRDPQRGRFMPVPADIIAALEGTQEAQARLALSAVLDAVRSVGRWPSVRFEDARIHAVLHRMGGWPAAYFDLTGGNAAEFEQRFMRLFLAVIDSPGMSAPEVLEGGDARIARDFGRELPEPVVIKCPAIGPRHAALPKAEATRGIAAGASAVTVKAAGPINVGDAVTIATERL